MLLSYHVYVQAFGLILFQIIHSFVESCSISHFLNVPYISPNESHDWQYKFQHCRNSFPFEISNNKNINLELIITFSSFMPSSHLPRMPCDKFFYDFLCNFFCIVGGYGLRRMCSHCLGASCDFFYGASGATRGKSVKRLCGDCTEIVQLPCSLRAASARKSYGARVGIDLRTVPVRGLCNATYEMSTGYGLTIFSNLSNFSQKQIVEAAEPVNPYENLTAASCLRREASRRPHGKGDAGRIRAP